MENAVVIQPDDSVATVIEPVARGGEVCYPGCDQPLVAVQDIPVYHKVAVRAVKMGEGVYKYGEKIGIATMDIAVGEHVHVHNVASSRA